MSSSRSSASKHRPPVSSPKPNPKTVDSPALVAELRRALATCRARNEEQAAALQAVQEENAALKAAVNQARDDAQHNLQAYDHARQQAQTWRRLSGGWRKLYERQLKDREPGVEIKREWFKWSADGGSGGHSDVLNPARYEISMDTALGRDRTALLAQFPDGRVIEVRRPQK